MSKTLSEMSLEELYQLFPIQLTEHKAVWKMWFLAEAGQLFHVLPREAVISHVGSTAVDGIVAKPIIDIMVEVPRATNFSLLTDLLLNAGYLKMCDSENRMSFNKGYTPEGFAQKVFHLHVRYFGDNDELYFRDFLNDNPDVAREYESLKLELLKKHEHDRDSYTEAKTVFVKENTALAKDEYKNRYRREENRATDF